MRVLLVLLLVAIVGCGDGSSPPGGGAVPTPEGSQAKADESAAQAAAKQKAAAKKSVEGREPLTLEGHSDWVLSVSFSPAGQRLACARDGSLEVWDVHSLTKSK